VPRSPVHLHIEFSFPVTNIVKWFLKTSEPVATFEYCPCHSGYQAYHCEEAGSAESGQADSMPEQEDKNRMHDLQGQKS
jgi:hypothetical protein